MTPADLRQKLHRQIDQLPSNLLTLAVEFLEFLKHRQDARSNTSSPALKTELSGASKPVLTDSTGSDLLRFSGTWHGDDFEECLESVYETRSSTEL